VDGATPADAPPDLAVDAAPGDAAARADAGDDGSGDVQETDAARD
jgi:hypothetical protein